ncbi:MAG: T9SS C-terminal target domain-containing protein [Saprospirales bacterium]|nr:MAG: T9SS C-terminal target domain-containing protein [Saprospirales bacterium]
MNLNLPILFCMIFTGLLFFSIHSNAQQLVCGDGILKNYLDRNYPEYMDRVRATFEEARMNGITPYRGQEIYTIPVVVHVVWNEEEENLHDSIIIDQIRIMNEDFRRLNPDAENLRPIFWDRVGDPGIEFELVAIERVQTTALFTPSLTALPDQLKRSADGGSDAWDPERYMNLWVCKLQPLTVFGIQLGQVLGYAYPPANLDNWPEGSSAPSPEVDGVVVDYRIFGRNNPLEIDPGTGESVSGYGRTTIHEIGHYLGLRHIWGDVLFGDGCSEDDGVEDTPNQAAASNWACDTTVNSCISPLDSLPDMIENYMDYSDERCMNSFTNGQIAIMRAVLEGPRSGLLQPVSTREEILEKSYSIYPNPSAVGIFNYSLYSMNGEHLKYQVFDQMGRLIQSGDIQSRQGAIDLSGNIPGLYFLRLIDMEGSQVFADERLLISGN